MQIDEIRLYWVKMPLIEPWRTAYGEDEAVESVLCCLRSGDVEAWGESSPLAAPCYSPEWAGGVFHCAARWMAPTLIGQEIESGEALQQRLAHFKGNPFAKACFDNAWWSLKAAIEQTPLATLLGATRTEAPVGADFGIDDSIERLLDRVSEAVGEQFPRVKLKYRPGWDLPMVRAVRERFPDTTVHIDCNSGYTWDDLPMFRELDAYQLAMFEQPLPHDDVVQHAELRRSVRTPICLDESITSLRQVETAIQLGSCHYVNIKPARVGGLTVAKQIHDRCAEAGLECWVGGMLESATGVSQLAALAMLDNFTYPADIFPSSRFFQDDLAETPIELSRTAAGVPCIRPLDLPPPPDPVRLSKWTVQSEIVARRTT